MPSSNEVLGTWDGNQSSTLWGRAAVTGVKLGECLCLYGLVDALVGKGCDHGTQGTLLVLNLVSVLVVLPRIERSGFPLLP